MSRFIEPFAWLLSFFYDLIPSYAVAITLLTLTVMVALLPLTVKGTRSMLAMQRLGPEIKKLQEKHKNDRQKLSEETMALYKDNKINPLGGCLPLLLQLPVFFVLYHLIDGITKDPPKYLDQQSALYSNLDAANGQMNSFGMNLASSATASHDTIAIAIPYFGLIALMIGVQYWQQHQIASRAPAVDTPMAQQMRTMQKFFPAVFGVISLGFPAGVVLYWVMSSLFRVGQQWAMYRFDPLLKSTVASAKKEAESFMKDDDTKPAALPKPKPNNKSNKSKKKRKGK